MLASGLISGGMNWWQAVLTIFLANVIVLIPMVLNAHAGTKYGIPFPVYCRPAFGIRGPNVPALFAAPLTLGRVGLPPGEWGAVACEGVWAAGVVDRLHRHLPYLLAGGWQAGAADAGEAAESSGGGQNQKHRSVDP